MIPGKRYLGDGVYVRWDGGGLVLTTENGARVTNEIVLEPRVYAELVAFMREVRDGIERSDNAGEVF